MDGLESIKIKNFKQNKFGSFADIKNSEGDKICEIDNDQLQVIEGKIYITFKGTQLDELNNYVNELNHIIGEDIQKIPAEYKDLKIHHILDTTKKLNMTDKKLMEKIHNKFEGEDKKVLGPSRYYLAVSSLFIKDFKHGYLMLSVKK